METAPLLIPLVIFVPALGTLINFFWGAKMGERAAGYIAVGAAAFTFFVSLMIFGYLTATHGQPLVVDPVPFFNGWLRVGGDMPLNMPWQFRVDTLSANMLLVVTGVGTLIHIYSVGYIHGDPKATRFMAYLNMFVAFMLILVTGNNLLMMFVGWEGVGLCSFLLIGYWWDKKGETGWQNSNAARKAMILNRVGDFGILMAIFLAFWTFGTADYYSAGEMNNPCFALESHGYEAELHAFQESSSSVCVAHHAATETSTATEEVAVEGEAATTEAEAGHGEVATDEHAAATEEHAVEGEHAAVELAASDLDNSAFMPNQLGIFAQAERLMHLEEGETIDWKTNADGTVEQRGREVHIGNMTLDIKVVIGLIVLFLLLGASGKSAQIPLFVWLPDAMAGPTPVSALMHAATMVTAGVYLLVRCSTLLELVPEARAVVAVIGATTALVAGIIAVGQWDIKRVLAFSTVSQLGFMVASIGVGGYVAAMFHLTTHAVFKALLFLGSGSVIHGVEHGHHHVHGHAHGDEHHDEAAHDSHDAHADAHAHHEEAHEAHHEEEFDAQDMRNMGGLRKKLPFTFITYLVGTFGLMGLPFFAGFWSKDEILLGALTNAFFNPNASALSATVALYVLIVLTVAAAFTTFYMWRQIQMVFFGAPRSEAANYAGGNSAWMIVPLVVLAYGTLTVGFMNVGNGTWLFDWFQTKYWYEEFLAAAIPVVSAHAPLVFNWGVAFATSIALPALAIIAAHIIYAGNKAVVERNEEAHELGKDPLYVNLASRPLWVAANRRLYWDDLYHAIFLYPYERIGKFLAVTLDWNFWHDYFHNNIIKKGFDAIGAFLAKPVDAGLIDAVVNGTGWLIRLVSGRSRGIQTGYVRTYAVALFVGVVVVIVLMLLPLLTNGS